MIWSMSGKRINKLVLLVSQTQHEKKQTNRAARIHFSLSAANLNMMLFHKESFMFCLSNTPRDDKIAKSVVTHWENFRSVTGKTISSYTGELLLWNKPMTEHDWFNPPWKTITWDPSQTKVVIYSTYPCQSRPDNTSSVLLGSIYWFLAT